MIERLQAKRNEEGFTLIELLIVIIVLGILAAIVVFAVSSTRKDSVASACKTDVKSLELSAEAVNTKTGSYPTGASPVVVVNSATATNPILADTVIPNNGALLKSWPSSSNYLLQWNATSKAVEIYPTKAAAGSFTVVAGGVKNGSAVTATQAADGKTCDTL